MEMHQAHRLISRVVPLVHLYRETVNQRLSCTSQLLSGRLADGTPCSCCAIMRLKVTNLKLDCPNSDYLSASDQHKQVCQHFVYVKTKKNHDKSINREYIGNRASHLLAPLLASYHPPSRHSDILR